MDMRMLLAVHLILCVFVTALGKGRSVSGASYMLPVVWLVPFAGCALFLAEAFLLRRMPDADRGFLHISAVTDEAEAVEEDEDADEDLIVPVEEAMVEESEEIRRRLMFHLLEARESDNIRLLQKIAASDDTELAHFASTRMMTFRRDHEHDIAVREAFLKENPGDRVTLEQYCALLKEYLDSGILPPAIARTYRNALKEGYEQLIEADPKDMDHREAYLRFLMEADVPDEDTKKTVEETLAAFPAEMRSYQMACGYRFLQNDRDGIDEILQQVKDRGVYLNQAGRRWYAFWRGETE